jgi:hypothetical protein
MADYSRESYKMDMRSKVFSALNKKPGSSVNKDETIRQIKKIFPSAMQGKPFYPELAGEVIDEDFGPNGLKLKEAIIQRFTIKETKRKTVQQQISFPGMVLDSLKTIASTSRYLEDAVRKLVENNTLLQNRKLGFAERLKNWISQFTGKQKESSIYELEYFDAGTSTTKRETIDFDFFITEVQKRVRTFNGISIKGDMYKRMEKAGEQTLFTFLEKQLNDLHIMYRRLQSLDTFFKGRISPEQRANIKGIKIELTAIKNGMTQALRKKREYVARKEEQEQMKKLGIE